MSFVTPHRHAIMRKYRDRGETEMPVALIFGVQPAYEIMEQFSGLHMDLWGEMEMVGTIMELDIEMVRCETIDLTVPAHGEIVVEGLVNLKDLFDYGPSVGPTSYWMPPSQRLPEIQVTADRIEPVAAGFRAVSMTCKKLGCGSGAMLVGQA